MINTQYFYGSQKEYETRKVASVKGPRERKEKGNKNVQNGQSQKINR